jgi:hypothetical protein
MPNPQQAAHTRDGSDQSTNSANDTTPANGGLLQPYLDQQIPATNKTQSQWTVAVDLGIVFDQVGARGHLGVEDKLKSLEQLKQMTKGQPVTIVVEALVADGKDVPGQALSQSKKPYDVERIVIRDGKEEVVASGASKGFSADLKDLLDYSLTQTPSNKIALAINAHGLGDQGVAGGMQEPGRQNGEVLSTPDLANVIESSLADSNHTKLDLIDLDSCLMGQMGVLEQLDPVTKQLVASEKTETVGLNPREIDGQDLTAWIKDVVAKPNMNGVSVGQAIVQHADHGANGLPDEEGTRTLTHFDLENHLGEFNAHLNVLGQRLTDALKDPTNREQIDYAVDRVGDVANDDDHSRPLAPTVAKRDMQGFLNLLTLEISSGKLIDPDHQLSQAITDMQQQLTDRNKLLSAAHIHQDTGIGGMKLMNFTSNESGLSVFLPNIDVRNNPALSESKLEKLYTTDAGSSNIGWLNFLRSLRQPTKQTSAFPSLYSH